MIVVGSGFSERFSCISCITGHRAAMCCHVDRAIFPSGRTGTCKVPGLEKKAPFRVGYRPGSYAVKYDGVHEVPNISKNPKNTVEHEVWRITVSESKMSIFLTTQNHQGQPPWTVTKIVKSSDEEFKECLSRTVHLYGKDVMIDEWSTGDIAHFQEVLDNKRRRSKVKKTRKLVAALGEAGAFDLSSEIIDRSVLDTETPEEMLQRTVNMAHSVSPTTSILKQGVASRPTSNPIPSPQRGLSSEMKTMFLNHMRLADSIGQFHVELEGLMSEVRGVRTLIQSDGCSTCNSIHLGANDDHSDETMAYLESIDPNLASCEELD